MTMYRATGNQLSKLADTEMVKVGGLSLSVASAARRFKAAVLAQAGLYMEFREPDLGDGWDAPRIGTAPDGTPCALMAAIARTAADVADDGRRLIVARAQVLQEQAAAAYSWPEASAWVPLEQQARDWWAATATIGAELAAEVGLEQTLLGDERALVSTVAQDIQDDSIAAAAAAAEAQLPAPEVGALQDQAAAWLTTAGKLGPDFAADCGPESDVAEIAKRAASIIAKADTFRSILGTVKRWRRESLAAIDAALDGGGSRQELQETVEQVLLSASNIATPAAGE